MSDVRCREIETDIRPLTSDIPFPPATPTTRIRLDRAALDQVEGAALAEDMDAGLVDGDDIVGALLGHIRVGDS
jgi:hypothetical protein